jgi:hypothetical protein
VALDNKAANKKTTPEHQATMPGKITYHHRWPDDEQPNE